MSKVLRMRDVWLKLAGNTEVANRIKTRDGKEVNVGFVNQFYEHSFIPNKWFDWESRVDANVMIIGQDWGPYSVLKRFIDDFEISRKEVGFDYNEFLFKTFSSRTEKFILNTLENTFEEFYKRKMTFEDWENFIFTVAVFFTRQGNHFRGNEFYDEKFGVEHSLPILKEQIEIVKPKVIIPLGGTAWGMLREIFDMEHHPEKISYIVEKLGGKHIEINDTNIIPIFHPASHTNPTHQKELWSTLWPLIS